VTGRSRILGRSGFLTLGWTGFWVAVALVLALSAATGLSVAVQAAISAAAVAVYCGVAWAAQRILGRAVLVYYHHMLAFLMLAATLAAVLGAPVLAHLDVTACGLAAGRAATLIRLARSLDLEGLRMRSDALERLGRERGVGPWTVGVVALQGLGRYDAGLVDDLALVKLLASLRRRWPEPGETAELLEPYGEWQGLASVFLLQGFKRGLVRGASMDRARLVRTSARNAA